MRTRWTLTGAAAVVGLGALSVLLSAGGSSAQVGRKPELLIYSRPHFEGLELRIVDNTVDLPVEVLEDGTLFDWNDNIYSFVVLSGTWRFYQHGRCNTELDDTPIESLVIGDKRPTTGWSKVVSAASDGPMAIEMVEYAGLDHDISSIELVSERNVPDWVARGE